MDDRLPKKDLEELERYFGEVLSNGPAESPGVSSYMIDRSFRFVLESGGRGEVLAGLQRYYESQGWTLDPKGRTSDLTMTRGGGIVKLNVITDGCVHKRAIGDRNEVRVGVIEIGF